MRQVKMFLLLHNLYKTLFTFPKNVCEARPDLQLQSEGDLSCL